MAVGTPVLYADFSGGINREAGPYLLQESECQDALNVTSSRLGSIEKRRGLSTYSELKNGSNVHVLGGAAHSLFAVNTATKYLLAAGPHTSAGNDAVVAISGTGQANAIKTDATVNNRWEWVQAPTSGGQGPIYGINGQDPPQYWTAASGTTSLAEWTAVDGAGDPISPHPARYCKYLIYHLDKVWASGDPNNPGRIFSTGVSSAANPLPDPRNWDTEDFVDDVEPYDGQQITGLGKIGPYLLVFKDRKTYVLVNPVDRAYRQISSTIGCVAYRSIVETGNGTFFLSEDMGVCVTDGSTVNTVSDKIYPILREAAQSYSLEIKNAAATYYEDSYYLSIPYRDNENSLLLEYNLETQSWWFHDCPANQFAILDPSGAPKLYGADPATRLVSRYFVPDLFSDNGSPFLSYWQGPFWAWGQPHINKRLHQLRIDGRGSWGTYITPTFGGLYSNLTADQLDWETQTDDTSTFAGSGNFAGTGTFAPQAGVGQYRYPTPARGWGRAWSLYVTDGVPIRTTQTQAELEGADDLDPASVNDMEIYAISAFSRTRTD